ncbi:hypothetical protein GCM10014719_68180 [Planomonospora parontospora subsp. antibiotica]|nr:hypothetical protein GCM10014719_68180 [Planomonospora parontospora subsp. antibiotica]GII20058.1 hypothetical protein Ppa05_67840 [Planomonospora parontospora subsp. antibiotica]
MSRASESSTPSNDLSSPPITAEEKIIPRQLAFFAGVDLQRNRILKYRRHAHRRVQDRTRAITTTLSDQLSQGSVAPTLHGLLRLLLDDVGPVVQEEPLVRRPARSAHHRGANPQARYSRTSPAAADEQGGLPPSDGALSAVK